MRRKVKLLGGFLTVLSLLGASPQVHATLNAVAPPPFLLSPSNAPYPLWYQDANGLGLDLCLEQPPATGAPFCILLPDPGGFSPGLPLDAPTFLGDLVFNYPQEGFYYMARVQMGQGNKTTFRAAVEGAWANGAVSFGTEMTFARISITVDVPPEGVGIQYTVTHPYGVETFTPLIDGKFPIKRDIGLAGAPFTGTLGGFSARPDVFLERAAGRIVVAGQTFIGNPAVDEAVTGSPFGTNFFLVEGPVFDANGVVVPSLQSDLFSVMGLVTGGVVPTPVTVTSATYHRTAALGSVDVLATSTRTAALTVTGGPNLPAGPNPMTGVGGQFFGTFQLTPDTSAVPATITVSATDPGPPARSLATVSKNVSDVVTITKALFDDLKHTLTIQATSSDAVVPPTLSALPLGVLTPDTQGIPTLLISNLAAPPATVTVTSSKGGSATLGVTLGAEQLTLAKATFRLSTRTWQVSGHTTVPGSTIKIFNSARPGRALLGSPTSNALGVWKFVQKKSRIRPNRARKISLVSSSGARLLNQPLKVRP